MRQETAWGGVEESTSAQNAGAQRQRERTQKQTGCKDTVIREKHEL